ncbi:leucine-rich repeat domain-containing protein [Arcanobacterium pinnipediorum]|uniref:Protein phosphatase 1 regulatory subunit 42 n=1 Tax=Arcanobacterium pinnipediorum TaxID=1503041 RepID=A0ABY5AIJ7_9ACTO|nr:protein phosphatase 1 regulatory subunit 42 [Arcanobacterium pinnipediorum]USR79571.1 protein phosphatase 1 regulatory subunit 42 [Arcanobacterium pinnipediorum]
MALKSIKATWSKTVVASTLALGLSLTPMVASAAEAIDVPDEYLANCINTELKKPAGSVITDEDAANLTKLSCRRGVTNLSALGSFTNLIRLDLGENPGITSIDEIKSLTNLTQLVLQNDTAIENFDALKNHPALERLTLNNTGLEDSDLKNIVATIPTLTHLSISNNTLVDLSPMTRQAFPNLFDLRLASNQVKDLSPLDAFEFKKLYAAHQVIHDGPTAYVPAGATTYVFPAQRPEIIASDGDSGVIIESDKFSSKYTLGTDLVTFTELPEDLTELVAKFHDPQPRDNETYNGWILYPVVVSDVTSLKPVNAVVDKKYSHQFTVTKGFPATKWTLASQPIPGLMLDQKTGTLTGTPTETGQYEIVIAIEDEFGNTINHTTTLAVETAPVVDTPVSITRVPRAHAIDPAQCDVKPYVTIEGTPGVEFTINSLPVAAGTYTYNYGERILVQAKPLAGFALEGQSTWEWTAMDRPASCDAKAPITPTPTTPKVSSTDGQLAKTGLSTPLSAGIVSLALLGLGGAAVLSRRMRNA